LRLSFLGDIFQSRLPLAPPPFSRAEAPHDFEVLTWLFTFLSAPDLGIESCWSLGWFCVSSSLRSMITAPPCWVALESLAFAMPAGLPDVIGHQQDKARCTSLEADNRITPGQRVHE
jgi:hypothetical protein